MFLKYPLYSCKAGKRWNQHVFTNLQKRCQILILTLWYLTLPYFLAKIAQILQKVIVFFLQRGEEIEPWFWHIWIAQSPMAEVFLHYTAHIFRFRPPSGGNAWSKLDQKCKLRVRLFFINSSISFKQCFSFLLGHIWANRNLPRLCIFMRV